MKYIVIKQGVFGYVAGPNKPVIAKTPKDPPVPVEDKLAERLVTAMVAQYADPVTETDNEQDPPADGSEYSEAMTREQLNEIAKNYGIEAPGKIKGGKAAVIEAIEAAKAAKEARDDGDDGSAGGNTEQPPAPGLADPV